MKTERSLEELVLLEDSGELSAREAAELQGRAATDPAVDGQRAALRAVRDAARAGLAARGPSAGVLDAIRSEAARHASARVRGAGVLHFPTRWARAAVAAAVVLLLGATLWLRFPAGPAPEAALAAAPTAQSLLGLLELAGMPEDAAGGMPVDEEAALRALARQLLQLQGLDWERSESVADFFAEPTGALSPAQGRIAT